MSMCECGHPHSDHDESIDELCLATVDGDPCDCTGFVEEAASDEDSWRADYEEDSDDDEDEEDPDEED